MLGALSLRLVWLLPFLLIAPEVLKVGGVFIRWDYLLLPVGALIAYRKIALERAFQNNFNYRNGALMLAAALTVFTVFQMAWSNPLDPNIADAMKYALWPAKILVWGLLVREVVVETKAPAEQLYKLFAVLACLILAIQIGELVSPAVRNFLFEYFPLQAQDRLRGLDYRGRGVFNGYDATSMFFCLSAIVLNNLAPTKGASGFWKFAAVHRALLLVCLLGAFLSARTGFLLLVLYLGAALWHRTPNLYRLIAVLAAATGILGLIVLLPKSSMGEEGSLLGRYLEIFNVIQSGGDLTAVNSFFGTLYMNYSVFFLNSWNPIFGNGLDPATTADQLYAKYLYMFGAVGLAYWLAIHAGAWLSCVRNALQDGNPIGRAAAAYLVIMALAHVKGGNYLFAQRLGELTMLVILLGLTKFKGYKNAQ